MAAIRNRSFIKGKEFAERKISMGPGNRLGQRFKMFSPRVGTPIYRAPEILHRGQMYSEAVDLWAVGCCLYFMLVGKPPFPDTTE